MRKILFSFAGLLLSLVLLGQGCISFSSSSSGTSGPAGMFISTDKGESWQSISAMPTVDGVESLSSASVYKLNEDPQDVKALYWSSREQGLYYSFDDGRSWQHSVAPLDKGFIYSLVVHPEEKCTIFASNGRQLFRTRDCARSWEEMFQEARPGNIISSIAFDPYHVERLYITQNNGELFRSTDLGQNWAVVHNFGVNIRDLIFDTNQEGLVYAASKNDGLYRSRDGGENWEDLRAKLSTYPGALQFRRFLVYPSEAERIYWVSKYGVLTSYNGGDNWSAINLVTPPGSVDIYGFSVNPLNKNEIYYTGTIDLRSTFYRSADGGKTWETRRLPSRQLPTVLRTHPEQAGWIYLGFTIPPSK